jgi:hypothetical protein
MASLAAVGGRVAKNVFAVFCVAASEQATQLCRHSIADTFPAATQPERPLLRDRLEAANGGPLTGCAKPFRAHPGFLLETAVALFGDAQGKIPDGNHPR